MKIYFFLTGILLVISGIGKTYANVPNAVPIGANFKNWQAQASIQTKTGFVVAGRQILSRNRSRILVMGISSACKKEWVRYIGNANGKSALYGLAMQGNQILASGTENGDAKIWTIQTNSKGSTSQMMRLDSGIARSVKMLDNEQLIVTIEKEKKLKVACFKLSGGKVWEKSFDNVTNEPSSLLTTRDGFVVIAFAGHGVAIDSCGKVFWQYHSEITHWKGILQKSNGELIFYGHQKMKMFGPENEEAFVMSVHPLRDQFEWFRSYGKDETFDAVYKMSEDSNGQLVMIAKQVRRLRFIELASNNTISKVTWLTDSLSCRRYKAIGILNQNAKKNRWLLIYNRSDGTVWAHPAGTLAPLSHDTVSVKFNTNLTDITLNNVARPNPPR